MGKISKGEKKMRKVVKKVISLGLTLSMLASFATVSMAEDNVLTSVTFDGLANETEVSTDTAADTVGDGWTVITKTDGTTRGPAYIKDGYVEKTTTSPNRFEMYYLPKQSSGVWELSLDVQKYSESYYFGVEVYNTDNTKNRFAALDMRNTTAKLGVASLVQNNTDVTSALIEGSDYDAYDVEAGKWYTYSLIYNMDKDIMTSVLKDRATGDVLGIKTQEMPVTSDEAYVNLGRINISMGADHAMDNIVVKKYSETPAEMTASDIIFMDEDGLEFGDISEDTGNLTRKIKVNFANPVAEDTKDSIKLYAGETEITDYTAQADGNSVILTLNNPLMPSTAHKIVVANTAMGVHGYNLISNEADFEYEFTTQDGTEISVIPLTKVTFDGLANETEVSSSTATTTLGDGWTVVQKDSGITRGPAYVKDGYLEKTATSPNRFEMYYEPKKTSGMWEVDFDVQKNSDSGYFAVEISDTSAGKDRVQTINMTSAAVKLGMSDLVQNNTSMTSDLTEGTDYENYNVTIGEWYTYSLIYNMDKNILTSVFKDKDTGDVLLTKTQTMPKTSTGEFIDFYKVDICFGASYALDNIEIKEYKEAKVLMSEEHISMTNENGEEITTKTEHPDNTVKEIVIDFVNIPEDLDGKVSLYKFAGSEWTEVSTFEGILNGSVYTMGMNARLSANSIYKIVVASDILTLQGNQALANTENFEYEFTTGEASIATPEVNVLEKIAGPATFDNLGVLEPEIWRDSDKVDTDRNNGSENAFKNYLRGLNVADGGNATRYSTAKVGPDEDKSIAFTFSQAGSNAIWAPYKVGEVTGSAASLNSTEGTYEFKVRVLKLEDNDRIRIHQGTGTDDDTNYILDIANGGVMTAGNESEPKSLGTAKNNVWYDITATIFMDSLQYRVNIRQGDTVIADNLIFSLPEGTVLSKLYLNGTYSTYIDDISFNKTDEKLYVKPALTNADVVMYNLAGEEIADKAKHEYADVNKIRLYFGDKVVNPEEVIKVEKLNSDGSVAENVAYSGNIEGYVNYELTLPLLDGNTKYRLTVGKDISNALGQTMDTNYVFEFETGKALCAVELEEVCADGEAIDGVEDITSMSAVTVKLNLFNCTKESETINVAIAYYKDNRLMCTESKTMNLVSGTDEVAYSESFTVPADLADANKVKVFAWDSLAGMKPYCKPIELSKN